MVEFVVEFVVECVVECVRVVLLLLKVVDVVVAPGGARLNLAYKSSSKGVEEVEFKNDELVVVAFLVAAVAVDVVVFVVVGCDDEVLYEKSRRRENSRARPMSSSYVLLSRVLLEAEVVTDPALS